MDKGDWIKQQKKKSIRENKKDNHYKIRDKQRKTMTNQRAMGVF